MKIEVTQNDIALGVRSEPCNCPVALALRRHTDQVWSVGTRTAFSMDEVGKGLAGKDYALPADVTDRIVRFDQGLSIEPFTFALPIQETVA